MKEIKVRNWRILLDAQADKSAIAGLLMYDGVHIPDWGCGMNFIIDKTVRYEYPEAVPKYVKARLEALRKHL